VTFDLESIYSLLPAVYRNRDLELDTGDGPPLKTFLATVAEQVAVLRENLEQLYDDEFIETCAEWVVPYIGDLVGARGLFIFPGAIFSQRALVANTIADRRRKGTAAILEQLARDVTKWDASVVEYFQLLAVTQYMKHIRPRNIAFMDLRQNETLENLGTPFETSAHTAEVRRIPPLRGRYNIPNIGIFLWRIGSHALTDAPAFRVDARRYQFDPLGRDMPLYNAVESEDEITHLAGPLNVPMPVTRGALDRNLDAYYGTGKSILLTVDGQEIETGAFSPPTSSISALIQVCNLSDIKDANGVVTGWAHTPTGRIAIDPELGRIAFPQDRPAPSTVRATWYYGFPAEMAGGDYGRATTFVSGLQPVINVPKPQPSIQAALNSLSASGGVVEVGTNGIFNETPRIVVAAEKQIELRAADEFRPILLSSGDIVITGDEHSEVTLNGLLIGSGVLKVPALDPITNRPNALQRLTLKHCTLLPGPVSIVVEQPDVVLDIQNSITGGMRVDTASALIHDTVIDTTTEQEFAYSAAGGGAGGPLELVDTTVIGRVHAQILSLVSDTIFITDTAPGAAPPVLSERRQQGCVRFSRVPAAAQTPRQYRCTSLRPVFRSLRYGAPAYCQLDPRCPVQIREGGDDGAEMGVYHNLFQPQRVANLRARLDEYLRFSLEAGIFFAS
jgi:hypothetical protein